jgi:dihydroorotate dehydrogenase (NAD+) catalytic subunit
MTIELAPNHKRSLTLEHPLIISSANTDARAGAIVTLPLTLYARGGAPQPRVIEVPGGFLMRTGAANPGLERMLHESSRTWSQSRLPIIVVLAAQGVRDWPAIAARLERIDGIGGIELHLNPGLDAAEAIRATRAATELPVLAKLDLDNAAAIAADCVDAGAHALVIGRAPRGMAMVDGKAWYGRLYSTTVKVQALRAVAEVAALKLGVPLIACGGVHSAGDARKFLTAGACAIEIDSAAWIDPALIGRIGLELGEVF